MGLPIPLTGHLPHAGKIVTAAPQTSDCAPLVSGSTYILASPASKQGFRAAAPQVVEALKMRTLGLGQQDVHPRCAGGGDACIQQEGPGAAQGARERQERLADRRISDPVGRRGRAAGRAPHLCASRTEVHQPAGCS